MASLTNYKGLEVVTPNPSGAGGLAINDDLKLLVDWSPKSKWDATASPTTSDDSSEDYQVGSLWYDTTSSELKICTDATVDAAEWLDVAINTAYQSGKRSSDLTINSTTLVSTGLEFEVRDGEAWRFECCLFPKELNTNADIRIKPDIPTGSTGRYAVSNIETAQVRAASIDTLSATVNVITSTDSDDTILINGLVIAGADGTVDIMIRNNTGTDTQIFHEYSYFSATKVS